MQRLGKFGDGGKWVCGMSKYVDNKKEKIVIYSFGVNDDSSFEAVMLDQIHNAEVWGYDYSVNHVRPMSPPTSKLGADKLIPLRLYSSVLKFRPQKCTGLILPKSVWEVRTQPQRHLPTEPSNR